MPVEPDATTMERKRGPRRTAAQPRSGNGDSSKGRGQRSSRGPVYILGSQKALEASETSAAVPQSHNTPSRYAGAQEPEVKSSHRRVHVNQAAESHRPRVSLLKRQKCAKPPSIDSVPFEVFVDKLQELYADLCHSEAAFTESVHGWERESASLTSGTTDAETDSSVGGRRSCDSEGMSSDTWSATTSDFGKLNISTSSDSRIPQLVNKYYKAFDTFWDFILLSQTPSIPDTIKALVYRHSVFSRFCELVILPLERLSCHADEIVSNVLIDTYFSLSVMYEQANCECGLVLLLMSSVLDACQDVPEGIGTLTIAQSRQLQWDCAVRAIAHHPDMGESLLLIPPMEQLDGYLSLAFYLGGALCNRAQGYENCIELVLGELTAAADRCLFPNGAHLVLSVATGTRQFGNVLDLLQETERESSGYGPVEHLVLSLGAVFAYDGGAQVGSQDERHIEEARVMALLLRYKARKRGESAARHLAQALTGPERVEILQTVTRIISSEHGLAGLVLMFAYVWHRLGTEPARAMDDLPWADVARVCTRVERGTACSMREGDQFRVECPEDAILLCLPCSRGLFASPDWEVDARLSHVYAGRHVEGSRHAFARAREQRLLWLAHRISETTGSHLAYSCENGFTEC